MLKLFKIEYNQNDRIFGLDLLRTIAILLVLLQHGSNILRIKLPNAPDFNITDGVDLFFVLSGFLIGSILINSFEKNGINKRSIITFWKRRWFRTLPNYYLILLVCFIYTLIMYNNHSDYTTDYLFFIQNFKMPHPYFLGVAWSLAVEEWFYLLFPLLIVIIYKVFPKLSIKQIIPLAIGIFIVIPLLYKIHRSVYFTYGEYSLDNWDHFFRKTVATRLDTIAFGVIGAYFNFYFPKVWDSFKYLKFIVGIALICFSQTILMRGLWHYTVFFDVKSLGILFLLPFLNSFNKINRYISIPITYISIISYSIYLIHYSLVLDYIIYIGKPFSDYSLVVYYCIYFISTILISILLFKFYEKPMMNLRNRTYTF